MFAVTVTAFVLICCRVHADVIIKDEPSQFTAVASDENGNQVPVTGKLETIQIFDIYPTNETDEGDMGLKIDINVSPLNESDVPQNTSTPAGATSMPSQQNLAPAMVNGADQPELAIPSMPVSQSTPPTSNSQPVPLPPTTTPASGTPSQTSSSNPPGALLPNVPNTNPFGFPNFFPTGGSKPTPALPFAPFSPPSGQLDSSVSPFSTQPSGTADYDGSYGSSSTNAGVDNANSGLANQSYVVPPSQTINGTDSGVTEQTADSGSNATTPSAGAPLTDLSTTNPFSSFAGQNVGSFNPFPNQPTIPTNPTPSTPNNADTLTSTGFPFSNTGNTFAANPFLGQNNNQNAFTPPKPETNFGVPFNPYAPNFLKPKPVSPLFGGKKSRNSGPSPDDLYYVSGSLGSNDTSGNATASKSNATETAPWSLPFLTFLGDWLLPGNDKSAEIDEIDYYDLPINDTTTMDGDGEVDPTVWYEFFRPDKWNNFTNATDRPVGPAAGFPQNAMAPWNNFKTWTKLNDRWFNFSSFEKTPTTEYAHFSFTNTGGDNSTKWSFNETAPEFMQVFGESPRFNMSDILRNVNISVLEPLLFPAANAPGAAPPYNVSDDSEILQLDHPGPGLNIAALLDSVQKIMEKLGMSTAQRPAFDFTPTTDANALNYADMFLPTNKNRHQPTPPPFNTPGASLDAQPGQKHDITTTTMDTESDYPADEGTENVVASASPAYDNSHRTSVGNSGGDANKTLTSNGGEAPSSDARTVVHSWGMLMFGVTAAIISQVVFSR